MGGDSITASPPDLAAALSLRLGAVALPEEVNAAVFSSVEAIAAVREFVHDRLLLGGIGDGQVFPEETVAALRLVEEGKAYMVDWGWLVWAFLRSDVLIGKRLRCSQYLLRLMKCQRPDLFSEVYGMFPGKRRKGVILQQEQNLLSRNRGYDQLMAAYAGVEEGSVFGLHRNTGDLEKMPAFRYVKDQQHRIETEDQEDGNHDNANVGPRHRSFRASRQQVLAHLSNMKNATLDMERTLAHTLAEIQHMKEKEKEKDNQIKSITEDTKKKLKEGLAKINQLEHEKMVMESTLHGCKKMLQESSTAFSEYRKMMCEESGVSSLDVVVDEKNRVCLMQLQRRAHEIINGIQRPVLLKFSACATKIKALLIKLADLNHKVQRLKDSRSQCAASSVTSTFRNLQC
uniref:Uncharacterized protein n=1 Tax=Avena sativa TaxID=4498 RepID=A0ACD5VUV4_AVESA